MSKYRFHLQKYSLGSKIACPSCERPRCFVKYVDEEGVVSFPNEVGKCDHEISCGYHYTPRDFFRDNLLCKVTTNLWKRRIKRDKCLRNACQ